MRTNVPWRHCACGDALILVVIRRKEGSILTDMLRLMHQFLCEATFHGSVHFAGGWPLIYRSKLTRFCDQLQRNLSHRSPARYAGHFFALFAGTTLEKPLRRIGRASVFDQSGNWQCGSLTGRIPR